MSGLLAGGLALAGLLLPAPYVVESPGPTFNTIGEVDGQSLISIEGERTFPVSGQLDLTTVYVTGAPNGVGSLDAVGSWLNPESTVIPLDLVYPPGTTAEEVDEENAAAMTSSQEAAVAAALRELGIGFTEELAVAGIVPESAAEGRLREGDILLTVDGEEVDGLGNLREVLNAGGGEAAEITVRRSGSEADVEVVPTEGENGNYQLGVFLSTSFDFPFEVSIALESVGGPSAGLMFALGIIDRLDEEDLTGGRHFAGTGTIDSSGTVGPIGGIRQKLIGAADAGAEFFLAPAGNCGEVLEGGVPDGLEVVKVEDLAGALDAVRTLGAGGSPDTLPRCTDS